MDAIPMWLLVVLVLLAVGVGLWVGHRAGEFAPADSGGGSKKLGARARDAATRGVVSLWKWNRARKKKQRDKERGGD
jgi:hypothetical protein